MSKGFVLVQSPVDTMSGYGHHTRDLVKSLFKIYPDFEFKFISLRWGSTPWGALDPTDPVEKRILDNILTTPNLPKQPDYFFQVSVPNEFRPMGRYNIGITAGIETNAVSVPWIEGMNRMDLNIVPSKHSKEVFEVSRWENKNPAGEVINDIRVTKPIEVLFEGVDTTVYKSLKSEEVLETVNKQLDPIPEDFNFLFVGHWLQGKLGHDRKDIGMMLKTFFETFADFDTKPGLILKTSRATYSIMDREDILNNIDNIREMVYRESPRLRGHLPNVYLLHGNLTNDEINSLYNHPKVKSMISFTKGEGYGRPLAEFSVTGKPLLVSKFSGPMDFCHPSGVTFLNGELKQVDKSVVWKDVIIPESKWFTVDYANAAIKMKNIWKDYGNNLNRGRVQKGNIIKNFSLEKMDESFKEILDRYVPDIVAEEPLQLPKLKKLPNIEKVKK